MKQLIKGRDGRMRAAILGVSSGDGQTSTFQRPIQLLYPLETDVKHPYGGTDLLPLLCVVLSLFPDLSFSITSL